MDLKIVFFIIGHIYLCGLMILNKDSTALAAFSIISYAIFLILYSISAQKNFKINQK